MKIEDVKKKELLPPNGTEMLCRNLVETTYDRLSEDNVRIFRDRLLDMTGCIFGGDIVPEDRFYYDLLKKQGGAPEAPLFADKGRLPVMSAVAYNCLHARANDFGNMYVKIFDEGIASHYGETMIPMNLTLADMYGVSGEEFITTNVAAEDTVARVLYTLPVRWPTDMQIVSSAAAAIAIRYYKLNAEQAKTAFSYAATNCTDPGNSYFDYCQEFKLHNAESARMGILAAEVARGGWKGLEDPFFGHWGLITNKVPEGELPDLYEGAFNGLGEKYYTENRFKKGPGGIPTTAAGELGKALRAQIIAADGAFDPAKVKAVHVYQSNSMRRNYYYNPFSYRNHTNALFSYRFATCCTLYHGDRTVALVQTPAILAHPELVRLAEEATMDTYDCVPGKMMMKAEAEMTDGRVFTAETDYNEAMKDYPTHEFLVSKFWSQFDACGKLPRSIGEKIIELAGKVETLQDMREYTELLVVK